MKINIGSGYQNIDEYVRIDLDPLTQPDYVVNLEIEPLPFEDSIVDEVVAHHIFEHLGDGFFHCLKELYRVCKDGALIDIRVPHHRHDHFLNDPTHKRPITVDGLRLFSQKYNNLCIETGDGSSKLGHFFKLDFEIVNFDFIFSNEFTPMLKDVTPEKEKAIQHIIMTQNNVIVETHVVWMVNKSNES